MADDEAAMVTALEVLGFNEEDAGEAFAQYTGILTLSDLIDMSDEDIKDSCYNFNKDDDNEFTVNMRVRRYLILLAFLG